jgi:hypothetical protein
MATRAIAAIVVLLIMTDLPVCKAVESSTKREMNRCADYFNGKMLTFSALRSFRAPYGTAASKSFNRPLVYPKEARRIAANVAKLPERWESGLESGTGQPQARFDFDQ